MIETGDRRFGILRSRFLARRHTALLVATGETISMSISIYLLLGLTWGMLYVVIWQFDPQAIALGAALGSTPASPENQMRVFPILTYFSLTTLSTIGFGDIVPLTLQARYAAVAEGITGQLYLAILVARLVGMHMTQGVNQGARNQLRTPETEEQFEP